MDYHHLKIKKKSGLRPIQNAYSTEQNSDVCRFTTYSKDIQTLTSVLGVIMEGLLNIYLILCCITEPVKFTPLRPNVTLNDPALM